MKLFNRKTTILTVGVVALIALGVGAYAFTRPQSKVVTPSKGNSTSNQPSGYNDTATATPLASKSTTNTLPKASSVPASSQAALSKPTLQKSSGNAPGSSVPQGSAMEFTCEGTVDTVCQIVLTGATNSTKVITLADKPIASNGRGSYFASWTWTAVSGSWSVRAKTSNSAGAVTESDSQTLEVK